MSVGQRLGYIDFIIIIRPSHPCHQQFVVAFPLRIRKRLLIVPSHSDRAFANLRYAGFHRMRWTR
jgi:hypothetical protein